MGTPKDLPAPHPTGHADSSMSLGASASSKKAPDAVASSIAFLTTAGFPGYIVSMSRFFFATKRWRPRSLEVVRH